MTKRPRLGFVGVGWIGKHRLEAVARSGIADIVAIADCSADARAAAAAHAPKAVLYETLDDVLGCGVDGVVIATPSGLHADQALAALAEGVAVFCQKPLATSADTTARIVAAAREVDCALGVDLSYRETRAAQMVRAVLRAGEIGDVFAADLVFHNAYGPDKAWYDDPVMAGGGCVMDLGVHLVDFALWVTGDREATVVSAALLCGARRLSPGDASIEDYAMADLDLGSGARARIACSWRLHAGADAVIEASFFGTKGGVRVRNVDGSFFDFVAEKLIGTRREVLCAPPDDWGGRAAVAWAEHLALGGGFDPEADTLVKLAEVVDGIYGR